MASDASGSEGAAGSLAFFLPDFAGGGAERMTLNLVQAMRDQGFSATLVVTRPDGALSGLVPPGVDVVVLNRAGALASFFGLARFLQAQRPDVLISAHGHNNIVALWARGWAKLTSGVGTRVIVQQHNVMSAQARAGDGWRFTLLPWLYRLFVGGADAVVAVSAGAADDLAAATGLSRDRIEVIPNPVIGPDVAAALGRPVDHAFFEAGSPPMFLTVGRFVPVKGLETAVEAFALVRARRPARLMMAGDGPLRPALEARVAALGLGDDVAFAGFVANPLAMMRRSAALLLPSRHEGFGAVIVEALAAGCPVVSTDCPFGPAEILENGLYGRLTPVGDAGAMARAMEAVLDEATDPARLQARAEDFTQARVGARYARLIANL